MVSGVRSVLSNRFRYVLLPSMLTKPCPPTAEVNITSPLPEFRDTLTLSPEDKSGEKSREEASTWEGND